MSSDILDMNMDMDMDMDMHEPRGAHTMNSQLVRWSCGWQSLPVTRPQPTKVHLNRRFSYEIGVCFVA